MTLIEYYWPVFVAGFAIALIVGRIYYGSRFRKGE